jgi:hypothetical protein
MKIRSVYLKGHKDLGDVNIEIRGEDGSTPRSFLVVGGNKSGKSLVNSMIRECWACSIEDRRGRGIEGVSGYVSYEYDGEIFVVRVSNGKVEGNKGLRRISNIEKRTGCVLDYGKRLLWKGGSGTDWGTDWGIRTMLQDLMRKDAARESVALIDDFDIGLDSISREKLYQLLFQYNSNLNNQLILFSREKMNYISRSCELKRRELWIDEIKADITSASS